MNNLDKQYQELLQDILNNGVEKETRNGKTLSVFGRQIRHKMSEGFPLITTKKMYWKGIVTELIWFTIGDTNIKYLVDNDCHIWDGDAYQSYLKRMEGGREDMIFDKETFVNEIKNNDKEHFWVKQFGELGPVYGKQWRRWNGQVDDISGIGCYHDQIANAIHLLKTNPDDRGIIVSAWNVGELDNMVLRPCHNFFQFYTRELSNEERCKLAVNEGWMDKSVLDGIDGVNHIQTTWTLNVNNIPTRAISLMYNARSQDVPLGTPFNIASYALLLGIIAKMVNMVPDELITNMGDCHIYKNQIDGIIEQLTREPYPLPTLNINTEFWPTESGECGVGPLHSDIDFLIKNMQITDFGIINYQSHPTIKMPLSN